MITYEDKEVEYALTRLSGSYFLYEDTIIEIRAILSEDPPKFTYVDMLDMSEGSVLMKDLSLDPPHFGYINVPGALTYVVRMPLRGDYKQGFRPQNLRSLIGAAPHRVPMKYYLKCLNNEYPSFTEAFERVSITAHGVAWHRDWALNPDLSILYKGTDVVGKVYKSEDGKEIRYSFSEDYLFLVEELLETIMG